MKVEINDARIFFNQQDPSKNGKTSNQEREKTVKVQPKSAA